MSMSNVSVKARLFALLGLLAAAMLGVGILGLQALKQANTDLDQVYSNNFVSVATISRVIELRNENVRAFDLAIMSGERQQLDAYRAVRDRNNPLMEQLWAKYQSLPAQPEERAMADDFMKRFEEYRTVVASITEKLEAGAIAEARELRIQVMQPRLEAMFDASRKLVELQGEIARATNVESHQAYDRDVLYCWIGMLLAVAAAVFLGTLLTRSMMSSLATAVSVAENIASGKLGNAIQITTQDEFGRLLAAMKDMDSKLSDIVGSVLESAGSVGAAARQLSKGNDDLSQRTQEQASALEETASSMEEMTATVKQNADNARQATQLAVSARDQADSGGDVAGRAVKAMAEISDSSKQIADIINVIDEIAFQTNLLALNAAVEAARAGEQGRGFAVVATEVRNLAQRSATAARQIKQLISDSVEKVKAGTALVDESGKSLHEIVASVKRVADIVAEISAASEEQASGIDQVNSAVTQMDTATQQNAALVEEAAAASKVMEQQSHALVEKVSYFVVAGSQARGTRLLQANVSSLNATIAPMPARKVHTPRPAIRAAAPIRAQAVGDDSSWTEF
ncbi:MAG TPA: methyl-accepting chemotaxis protein [Steroidobacter sp.]|uniref:methyl-accepting chemotaxis protein n=1 Tax=Steroidobacter sp. TaxID=1978227 RepID=UPI002ED9386D